MGVCLTGSGLDMLEEFSAAKIESTQTDDPSGPGRPASSAGAATAATTSSEPNPEDMLSDDDFAKKLQAEMAEMMGGIGDDVSPCWFYTDRPID